MSEIKIIWENESIELSLQEAEGFAESLEEEGEEFEWVDLRPTKESSQTGEPGPCFFTDEEPKQARFSAAAYSGPDHLTQKSAVRNAAAVAAAELAEQAKLEEVPTWVLRVREGLKSARANNADPSNLVGLVCCRQDGTWYWYDETGAREDLPRNAGDWFTDDQTEI